MRECELNNLLNRFNSTATVQYKLSPDFLLNFSICGTEFKLISYVSLTG